MADFDVFSAPSVSADFGFTEEHGAARAEARRFLSERCPISEIRRLADDPVGFEPALHREIAELGWLGLVTSEELGGLGLDHLHLALLMDEMGRVLLPAPFLPTVLALRAIEVGGALEQRKALVPDIVAGKTLATIALSEPNASFEPNAVETRAERAESGFVLTGVKTHVLFGDQATLCIVPARLPDDRVALFAVPLSTGGVRVEREVCIDTTRPTARITLDGARVASDALLAEDGLAAQRAVHLLGWVALASEMAGGIEATLELTRKYAIERIQFGRPIGAFQAVKHPIVDVMIGCEWVRSAALGAAATLDQDPARGVVFARMAKALAGDVYIDAAKKGVQLHGGFGFTWDCDVHFYFKRALHSGATLGDGAHHRRHLGAMVFE